MIQNNKTSKLSTSPFKTLRTATLMLSVLALSACTAYDADLGGDNHSMTSHDSAYSTGVGSAARFGGNAQALKGGFDQTYYFDFDSADVAYDDVASIDAQASYLSKHRKAKIVLEGHTDERGSREYNVALAERRAKRIAEVLKIDGVKAPQIRIVSYGQEKPAVIGHNESSWKMNRRVHLRFEK